MTRGVLVAVVLGGLAGSAWAKDPARVQPSTTRAPEAGQDFRLRGPSTFDVAVRSRDGHTAVYRYDRAQHTVSLVERLEDRDVPRRTGGFQSLSEGRIVLSPEGGKKPPSPQPPGGEPEGWLLPDAERKLAVDALQKLVPGGQVVSIGHIQAATP